MTFRKGDIVSVRGTIEYDERDDSAAIFIRIPGAAHSLMLNPDERDAACVKLEIPQFRVGDLVSFRWVSDQREERESIGRIAALLKDHAWIDLCGGEFATRTLTSITRMEEPEAPNEA